MPERSQADLIEEAEAFAEQIGPWLHDNVPDGLAYSLVLIPREAPEMVSFLTNLAPRSQTHILREAVMALERGDHSPPRVIPRGGHA